MEEIETYLRGQKLEYYEFSFLKDKEKIYEIFNQIAKQ